MAKGPTMPQERGYFLVTFRSPSVGIVYDHLDTKDEVLERIRISNKLGQTIEKIEFIEVKVHVTDFTDDFMQKEANHG